MVSDQTELKRPIRVVMFGSGPRLTHDAKQFLCQLEAHPEIVLLEAFCQAEGKTPWAIVKDKNGMGLGRTPLTNIEGGTSTVFEFLNPKKENLHQRVTLRYSPP